MHAGNAKARVRQKNPQRAKKDSQTGHFSPSKKKVRHASGERRRTKFRAEERGTQNYERGKTFFVVMWKDGSLLQLDEAIK